MPPKHPSYGCQRFFFARLYADQRCSIIACHRRKYGAAEPAFSPATLRVFCAALLCFLRCRYGIARAARLRSAGPQCCHRDGSAAAQSLALVRALCLLSCGCQSAQCHAYRRRSLSGYGRIAHQASLSSFQPFLRNSASSPACRSRVLAAVSLAARQPR